METNSHTKRPDGRQDAKEGGIPLSIVVFEDDPYHFRLLRHHLVAINPDHELLGH